jgi:transposase
MTFHPIAALREWKQKVALLQERWRGVRQENEQLRKEIEQLRRREKQWEQREKQLAQERERLREENEKLKRQLEEAQRANKRQAAPFSRGRRKPNPQPPGRKSGTAYGQRYSKAIPEKVDEVIAVPPPGQCECGGALKVESIESQFQQEIVRPTIWRRFDISIGRCQKCHKRVQGRDPRQTSDALGAAAVQLGPAALALAVRMNKGLGMPHSDVAAVLQDGFQLQVNRSTICRAVDRVARRGETTWHALRDAARRSMVNGIDETGWNVAAQLRWLWVAVSEQVTFCDILPGRGFPQAASILGAEYEGWLTHDGWKFFCAPAIKAACAICCGAAKT